MTKMCACAWHFSLYWAKTSSGIRGKQKLHHATERFWRCEQGTGCIKTSLVCCKTARPLWQQIFKLESQLLRKRRTLTARVRSRWPVCSAGSKHVADISFLFFCQKLDFTSAITTSGPVQIKCFKEPVIGSDLFQTKHGDLVNFTRHKRNVAKPHQPDLTIAII